MALDWPSVFVIDRSATAVTSVVSPSLLFAAAGSFVAVGTEAVLLTVPPSAGAVPALVLGGAAQPRRRAAVRVPAPPVSPQVQPEPEADTKVSPAGSVSVT